MAADLTIVNLALSRFGQAKITQAQLTADVHPSAVAANSFYDSCRDEVLGESDWPFATVTKTLSSLSIDDYEWDYVYSYPTMAVSSIFNIFNSATATVKNEQEFEVRHIPTLGVSAVFCSLSQAIAEYTYQVTTTSLWSRKFVTALSYRLAAEICVPITGDSKKALQLLDMYNAFLGEAKRLGHSEKRKSPNESSRYQDAR